ICVGFWLRRSDKHKEESKVMKLSKLFIRTPFLLVALGLSGAGCNSGSSGDEDEIRAAQLTQKEAQDALDNAARGNPEAARRVRGLHPIFECVEAVPGKHNVFSAHFGYVNNSNVSLNVPVGLFNFFVPAPINRGQPTTFLPGTHSNVVQAEFTGAIAWALGLNV